METNYDLVLKGGHVIDPANGIDAIMDVAVKHGRIAAVGANLDASHAETVVDATGLTVSPGLIDIHVHVYPHFNRPEGVPGWDASVIADAHSFRAGVTTFVDAGCAGAEHFQDFRRRFVETSKTRVLAFVNIANGGMGPREQDPFDFNVDACAHAVREHSDVVVGVKTAHYWTQLPWDDLHTPWASVDARSLPETSRIPRSWLTSGPGPLAWIRQPVAGTHASGRYPHACLCPAVPDRGG